MVSMFFNAIKVHSNQKITQVWGGKFSGIDGGTPLLKKDGYHIDTRPLPLYPEAVYEACDRCHFGLYDPVGR